MITTHVETLEKNQKCDRLSSDVEPLSMTVGEHLLVAEQFPINEPVNERLLVAEDIPPEELLPTVQQLSVREQLLSADIDEQSDLPGNRPPAVETKQVPLDEQLPKTVFINTMYMKHRPIKVRVIRVGER